MSYGQRVLDFVSKICREFGTRLSGSEGEVRAGEYIYEVLSKFCDRVDKVWFSSRPRGFLDYIWVVLALYVIGALLYFLNYWIAITVFSIMGLAIFVLQQCLHYEVIDFMFPKVSEFHIIGRIRPTNEAKKRVIISAHYDSPYEFPLLGRLRMRSPLLIMSLTVTILVTSILGVTRYFIDVDVVQKPLIAINSILLLFVAATLRSSRVSCGANDDLAGVGVVIEAGRILSEKRPKKTEVWIAVFAGEEHMRGTKRFVKDYYDELKDAIMFNFETPSGDYFLITTEEKMFFAKHSPKAVEIAKRACEKIKVNFKVGPLLFAGSDSANFSRRGLHATTIFGLAKDGAPHHWHTLKDVPENLNVDSLSKAVEIALTIIEIVDQEA